MERSQEMTTASPTEQKPTGEAPPLPADRWLRADQVPPGYYWMRNEHFPRPRTPLGWRLLGGGRGMAVATDEFSVPVSVAEAAVVDGHFYFGRASYPAPSAPERIAA